MKKGRLKYIIIIVIIVVYGIGMYLVFGVDESRERRATTTLLIGDETVLNYTSRQWLNVTSQELLSSINWQDFNVYIDNEYFGNYLVWRDDRWYLFNQNREAVSYQGNDFFAYKAGFEMDVLPFQTTQITDFSYVNQVLENHGLASNPSYTLTEFSSFDFDKDGVNEDFYIPNLAILMQDEYDINKTNLSEENYPYYRLREIKKDLDHTIEEKQKVAEKLKRL